MLTHEDLLLNLRLSPPNAPPQYDVIKELDGLIAVLQELPVRDLNEEVTITVLQSLKLLIQRGEKSSTLPLMTAFDMCPVPFVISPPDDYDPVGLTMGYDSAYDEKA